MVVWHLFGLRAAAGVVDDEVSACRRRRGRLGEWRHGRHGVGAGEGEGGHRATRELRGPMDDIICTWSCSVLRYSIASSSIDALSILLQLGMSSCSARIFSLIRSLLLLSDMLCTSAVRPRFVLLAPAADLRSPPASSSRSSSSWLSDHSAAAWWLLLFSWWLRSPLSEQTDEVVAVAAGGSGAGADSGALASGCSLVNGGAGSGCRRVTGAGAGGGGAGAAAAVVTLGGGGCSHAILCSENSGVLLSWFVVTAAVDMDSTGAGAGGRCSGLEKKVKFRTLSPPLGRGCCLGTPTAPPWEVDGCACASPASLPATAAGRASEYPGSKPGEQYSAGSGTAQWPPPSSSTPTMG